MGIAKVGLYGREDDNPFTEDILEAAAPSGKAYED